MGTTFFDHYSILHLAIGIVAFHLNINAWMWFILHTLFEIVENTPQGVYFIGTYLWWWPGGKTHPDAVLNSIGDTVFAMIGWYIAYLSRYFEEKK